MSESIECRICFLALLVHWLDLPFYLWRLAYFVISNFMFFRNPKLLKPFIMRYIWPNIICSEVLKITIPQKICHWLIFLRREEILWRKMCQQIYPLCSSYAALFSCACSGFISCKCVSVHGFNRSICIFWATVVVSLLSLKILKWSKQLEHMFPQKHRE